MISATRSKKAEELDDSGLGVIKSGEMSRQVEI